MKQTTRPDGFIISNPFVINCSPIDLDCGDKNLPYCRHQDISEFPDLQELRVVGHVVAEEDGEQMELLQAPGKQDTFIASVIDIDTLPKGSYKQMKKVITFLGQLVPSGMTTYVVPASLGR